MDSTFHSSDVAMAFTSIPWLNLPQDGLGIKGSLLWFPHQNCCSGIINAFYVENHEKL
jgi:hypothetical protein